MGEVNRSRKQDLPLEIESPDDLPQHLICQCCKMDLRSIPLIHLVAHRRCPSAIPQRKKFTIHFWPEELSIAQPMQQKYPRKADLCRRCRETIDREPSAESHSPFAYPRDGAETMITDEDGY